MNDHTDLLRRLRDMSAYLPDISPDDALLLEAADAIAALREQLATKDAEIARLRRTPALVALGSLEPISARQAFDDGYATGKEKAEADNAALRAENARLLQEVLSPGTIPFNWKELEADNAALVAKLVRIYSFLGPEDVRLPDGRVMRFNNPTIEREMLRELSAAIRAIPDAALLAGKESVK